MCCKKASCLLLVAKVRSSRVGPSPPVTKNSPPSRVSVWSPDGELLSRWGRWTVPCEPGDFFSAHGSAVDSHGDSYVGLATRIDLINYFRIQSR